MTVANVRVNIVAENPELAGDFGDRFAQAQVSAVEVYTAEELTVSNGTEARLQCTFTSSAVISRIASVTWSFQGQGSPSPMAFFYFFSERAYPGVGMPFKDRVSWAGDLNKRDASINIANIQFQDSGTYLCDVKNPPDNIVTPGAIKLQVVERDSAVRDYRTRNILCLAVAGVILLLLVLPLLVHCGDGSSLVHCGDGSSLLEGRKAQDAESSGKHGK